MAVRAASVSGVRAARWSRNAVYVVGLASLASALLAGANALLYYRGHSINEFVTTSVAPWAWAPQFALPILGGIATLGYVLPATRVAARGALIAIGFAGVLVGVQELGAFVFYPGPAPGIGLLLGLLASALLLGAGLIATACSGARGAGGWALRLARVVTLAGGVCVIAGAFIPWANTPQGHFALLSDPAGPLVDKWYALAPVGLAMAAMALAFARGVEDRLAGGALLTGGVFIGILCAQFLTLATLDLYEARAAGSLGAGGFVSLAGGLLVACAGAWLLLARRTNDATAASAADAFAVSSPLAYSAATRYLCAAAQLDERFARESIQQVLEEAHRAVAPSLGIDLGTMLRHCLAARRRRRVRDLLVTILVVAIVILFAYRRTPAGLGYVLLLFALVLAVVFADVWTSRYRIAARTLTPAAYDPAMAPTASARDEDKIAAAVAAERGNVTVYSGYWPFVGSGWEQGGWAFALNVSKGKRQLGNGSRLTPRAVEVDELYDVVRRDVEALALSGVAVEDRVYVDGQRIRDDDRFLADRLARPRPAIDGTQLAELVERPELANRVYRCIRLSGWEGEFVLSIFLNFAGVGTSLFAEVRYFLLAPFKDAYLAVDQLDPSPSLGQRLRVLLRSIPTAFIALVRSPYHLLADLIDGIRRWRTLRSARRRIRSNPSFDYGSARSVRELAQSTTYRRYFQQLDRDRAGKVLERQILDSILRHLDERDVDTSELEERQTAILNNGVIVSGGTLSAESLAVGTGARAGVARATRGVIAGTKSGARNQ